MTKRSHKIRKTNNKKSKADCDLECQHDTECCPYKEECMKNEITLKSEQRELKKELMEAGIWQQIIEDIGERDAEAVLEDMVEEMMMG